MSEPTPARDLIRAHADTLTALHRALEREHDSGKAAQVLRDIGVESGDRFLEHFREWLSAQDGVIVDPANLTAAEFWERLGAFFTHLGWGRLEQSEPHPGLISLTASDWIESTATRAPQPCCHFTTGLLADFLSKVAEQDVAAMEVECRSAGGTHCRFLIGGLPALERIFDQMQGGQMYTETVAALS